jgi:hypothetical protein
MIIDNPHVMRDVIQQTGAKFTHPGAEQIYTSKKDKMDAYAAAWGELADRVWEEEYQSTPSAPATEEAHEVNVFVCVLTSKSPGYLHHGSGSNTK